MRATAAALLMTLLLGAAPAAAEKPLARVNGKTVEAADLRAYLANRDAGGSGDATLPQAVALEELINRRLLLKAARERGLAEEAPVKHALQRARREILVTALLERVVAERVTDQRAKSYYQRHFGSPDRLAQLSLVRRTADSKARARELARRMQEGGDGDAEDAEWVFPALLPPALAKAMESVRPGAMVGPVATDGGWTVVRVTGQRQVEAPPLDRVRSGIRQRLAYQAIRDYIAQLRDSARIEYVRDPGHGD